MEQEKCTECKGDGGWILPNNKGGTTFHPCVCEGSGLRIDQLKSDVAIDRIRIKQIHKDLRLLQEWVLKNSECKTCGGDQMKTLGMLTCGECGLPGNGFWGG